MKPRLIFPALWLAATILLLTALPALAWPEEPFAKVELSGPGLNGVIPLTGDALGGMTIQNFMRGDPIRKPDHLGDGYELHRYFRNRDGTLWDFDRVRYYADPAGGLGYVEYVDGIGYSPAWNEGHWFRAKAQADVTMTRLLASQNIAPPPASAPARSLWPLVSLAAALTLGLLIVVSVRGLKTNAAIA